MPANKINNNNTNRLPTAAARSAWPNAFFDLCGICCGHFQMNFWTFLAGTVLGKAGVKVACQAMFLVTIFNKKTLDSLLGALRGVGLPGGWVDFVEVSRYGRRDQRRRVRRREATTRILALR